MLDGGAGLGRGRWRWRCWWRASSRVARSTALVLVGGWILLSAVFYVVGPEFTERKLLAAGQAGDSSRLQRMADVQARAIGMAPPQVTVSALAPEVLVVGGDRHARGPGARLSDAEQWALIAHELAHMRCGHTFWLNLMRRSRQASGLMLVPAFPAQVVARGLDLWEPFADFSADRLALVLTRDSRDAGPGAAQGGRFPRARTWRSPARRSWNTCSARAGSRPRATEVTTHYKLGQLLHDHKDLHERLRQLGAYAASDAFKRAAAQIEAGLRPRRAAQATAPPSRRRSPPPRCRAGSPEPAALSAGQVSNLPCPAAAGHIAAGRAHRSGNTDPGSASDPG